jgi:hypothetical protein
LEISRTVLLVKVSELILRSYLRVLLVVLLLLLARRNGRWLRYWWPLRD